MKRKTILFSASMAILTFAGGCVNHVKNMDYSVQETERKIITSKHSLTIQPEKITDASFSVTLEKLQRVNVLKYERNMTKEIYTPYSFWREIYEVPSGIVMLPVSLCTHIFFIATFGMLPYDVPQWVNNTAFAGMNPFMNWESESRTEERLVESEKKTLSEEIINEKVPYAKTAVIMKAGDFSKKIMTDEFGSFSVHFLAADNRSTFFPMTRKISFLLPDDNKKSMKDIILTREFLGKLLKARAKINAYKFSKPSGRLLYQTVVELEKMKFDQLAYFLEEAELLKHKTNKKFQQDFKDAAQEQ